MSERELTEEYAIMYAKNLLGRSEDFKQVFGIKRRERRPLLVHLPIPATTKIEVVYEGEPRLVEFLQVDVPITAVLIDNKAKFYMGYCEELDALVYYPVVYCGGVE